MLMPSERDTSPIAQRLAELYRDGPYWHVPLHIKELFKQQVCDAFKQIPVAVQFVQGDEPYKSRAEMSCRLLKDNIFLVRHRKPAAHPLGKAHEHFRAVHDWFGHHMHGLDFGLPGELDTFQAHVRDGTFSAETLPLVWSEVVLENAFYCHYGHWMHFYKPVFDPSWGIQSGDAYGSFVYGGAL